MTRLEAEAAFLSWRFRLATPARRAKAVTLACKLVVEKVNLHGVDDIAKGISHLEQASPVEPSLRIRLETLATQFDDAYLELVSRNDGRLTPESMIRFAQARAVSALDFALSDRKHSDEEALYEALFGLDQAPDQIRAITDALGEPIRDEVARFIAAGPLPESHDATVDQIQLLEKLLMQIEPPVSREEAVRLAAAFGPDDCFGLAWTLVHLIESAPGGVPLDEIPRDQNEWTRLLWNRSR